MDPHKLSDSSGSREHPLRSKSHRVSNGSLPLLPLVIAALAGGGGTSILLPKVAPEWYRPDPATGAEIRELRAELFQLRQEFDEFLLEGPREVRDNQTRILAKLQNLEERIDFVAAAARDTVIREMARLHEKQ